MKRVQSLTERKPCRASHKSIDDVAVHAVSGECDCFIACFRGNCDDVPTLNLTLDLQIFVGISIVNRRCHRRNFRNSHIGHGFNLDDESGFIAVIANFDVVCDAVAAEGKRLVTLRKGKEKSARNTARRTSTREVCRCHFRWASVVISVNGGSAVPVWIGAENGDLPVCVTLEVVDLTSLHIAFGVHINAGGLVENLDISGRFHHTIECVTAFFQSHATHFKADDKVSLFDESVVEVASVHACVA